MATAAPKKATIYRMVMPTHTCPYGLKAKDLLRREGYDVVLARRSERRTDTYAKRGTAALFYRVHNAISDTTIPDNAGDFRLMSRQVVESLKQLPENRRFMKGLFAWVGFRTAQVDYIRPPRIGGKTKFSGWKLWNLALEGMTSFSTLPLRVWTYVGSTVAAFAVLYGAFIVVRTLLKGNAVPGYASLASIILFLGGIQLIGIGVIGEYLGRVYFETKHRPIYLVRRRYDPIEVLAQQSYATTPDTAGASGRWAARQRPATT